MQKCNGAKIKLTKTWARQIVGISINEYEKKYKDERKKFKVKIKNKSKKCIWRNLCVQLGQEYRLITCYLKQALPNGGRQRLC